MPQSILKNWQKTMESNYHESVMVREVLDALDVKKGKKYIDATLGTGGHAAEILSLGGEVMGIDLDPKMVEIGRERLIKEKHFKAVHGSFTEIDKIAGKENWTPVAGILFDLGVSNIHLKDLERGFSFENPDAELDMRIDPETQGVTASDLLNVLREDQLREMFEVTLDPGAAKWITGRVIHSRAIRPIRTVEDMLEVTHGLRTGKRGLNEATLPFLAIRIAVNSELDNLQEALPKAFGILSKGGRLAVISFHSKEDGIVKNFMREISTSRKGKLVNYKPVEAGEEERDVNRKSRSAKMRIIEKII